MRPIRRVNRTMMKRRALTDIARVLGGRGKIGRVDGLRAALSALRPSGGDVRENDARVAAEELRTRIAEASRYFPHDQLGLSTQCGFASGIKGNPVDASAAPLPFRIKHIVVRFERQAGEINACVEPASP